MDRLTFAREQAEAFNARTHDAMKLVLESHTSMVVDYVVQTHAYVDELEQMLITLSKCPSTSDSTGDAVLQVPSEISRRLKTLVASIQRRDL